jgi:hypothetical protein
MISTGFQLLIFSSKKNLKKKKKNWQNKLRKTLYTYMYWAQYKVLWPAKKPTQPYQDLYVYQFLRFFLQNLVFTYMNEKKLLPTRPY